MDGQEALDRMKDGLKDITKGKCVSKTGIAKALCKGQKKESFEDEITHSLLVAKKIIYYKEKEFQNTMRIDLNEYLQEPIDKYSENQKESEELKKELNEFLTAIEPEEKKVPEFLTCPLTTEIINKPILLSSGNTYEKRSIENYFAENGYKDPVTKEPVSDTLIDNINLRQAIEDYIEK